MKIRYPVFLFAVGILGPVLAIGQCPTGFTAASVNWDGLHFLPEGTNVSGTIAKNQKFAFGKNTLTITHTFAKDSALGENTTNTAEAGSFGAGADVQFINNGTVNFTFATAVQNVKFSVYDIDYNQKVTVTALNGALPVTVTLAKVSGTVITLSTPNPALSVSATAAPTTALADNSTDGTINVSIAGPVTSFKLVVTQTGTKTSGSGSSREDGSFWVSDIAACIGNAAFPNNYGLVSKPFTGQPGYVLVARNNEVYMTDPATGVCKLLFADPSLKNINSLGYDPYNRIVYYTYSLTGSGGVPNPADLTINKWNYNTNTFSIFVADVTTLGIPVFGSGVESGGAAFYDGAFYIGIEGGTATGDESIAWRIDLDASLNATTAMQVYALPTAAHDWGDFAISDGILYDFDGKAGGNQDVYHSSLQTGALTDYVISPDTVHQVASDWNGQIFNIGAVSGGTTGEVMPYRFNGKFNAGAIKQLTVNGVALTGSWGDAGSAFKPKSDFGDAPASYDPNPLSPAMHDPDINLRIGNTLDYEDNRPSAPGLYADGDGADEDGLTFVRILNMNGGNYQTDVNVFNNTGANATLAAWIDFNNDGKFDAGEGIIQTVATSAAMQTKSLYWTGIGSNLANNSNTYLRMRITSAANGMTTANSTGYFANGEVEDWYVPVNTTVLANPVVFAGQKAGNTRVVFTWSSTGEANTTYEVERSADGQNWYALYKKPAQSAIDSLRFGFTDYNPLRPRTYYRLKYQTGSGNAQYSKSEVFSFASATLLQVYPNPAAASATVVVTASRSETAVVTLQGMPGFTVHSENYPVQKGKNILVVKWPSILPPGHYTVQVVLSDARYQTSMLIQRR